MMKFLRRTIFVLLLVMMCVVIIPQQANALKFETSGTCGDNLKWNLDENGTLTVSGTGYMTNYEAETETPWYNVRSQIYKVVIEDGTVAVGDHAFEMCGNLSEVVFPANLISIGNWAFGDTAITNVELGSGIESIGEGAFYYCASLESVVIYGSVEYMGDNAFGECVNLTEVVFKSNISAVGAGAFAWCESLDTVIFDGSVESIDQSAFESCTALKYIVMPDIGYVGEYAFGECTALETIIFKGNVGIIETCAFAACENLETINFNGEVEAINENAFEECTALVSVNFNRDVDFVNQYAFYTCTGLQSVNFNGDVNAVGYGAFYGCTSLESVTFTDVDYIGESAFADCTNLVSVTITGDVDVIGYDAFSGCTSLSTVIFGGDIERIEAYAFGGCDNLYYVLYHGTAKEWSEVCVEEGNEDLIKVLGTYDDFVKIKTQPQSAKAAEGKKATVTVTAEGHDLKYKWYYKNAGSTKFTYTSSFKGNSYSVEMSEVRSGRQVYCVVTDKYGNEVKTNTVTLTMIPSVKITSQPKSVTVADGETAKVTVKATGEGLTYKWYYKNAGSTKFTYTSSFKGNSYSVAMSASRAGRQVYCKVTDKYGNTVTTNTVTLKMAQPVKITTQPKSVTVAEGAKATVTVKATGDGLTYKWYYKNPGSSKFSYTSTFTGNTYSVTMSEAKSGRQVYCVITDKYGNSVTTNTVTLKMK